MRAYLQTMLMKQALPKTSLEQMQTKMGRNAIRYTTETSDTIKQFPRLGLALNVLLERKSVDVYSNESMSEIDALLEEIVRLKSVRNKYEITYSARYKRKQLLVNIPYASTEQSFRKSREWIDSILLANAATPQDSVRRMVKHFTRSHYDTVISRCVRG
jgi:hypothetical protein